MQANRILMTISALVVTICAYVIYSSIHLSQTTGILKLSSSDTDAVLTISQINHSAQIIGRGDADVRLPAGAYQVAASDQGRQQFVVIQIRKKQTTNQRLNPTKPASLPSVASIDFVGLGTFTSSGLSNIQISYLKQYFFQFKPTARVVAIPASTVSPGPHDPNTSTSFTINFKVSIDSFTYRAMVSYSGINDLRLQLFGLGTGAQVFDSGSASTAL